MKQTNPFYEIVESSKSTKKRTKKPTKKELEEQLLEANCKIEELKSQLPKPKPEISKDD
jgi:hypothetical protein